MALACCIVRNITSWLRRLESVISCLYFSDLVKRSTDYSSHSLQRSCRDGKQWLRRLESVISCLYFSDLVKRSIDCSSHSLQRSCKDGKQWPDVPLRPQAHVQDEDVTRRKVVSSWLQGVMGKGPEKLSEKWLLITSLSGCSLEQKL
jgi:hypothetical protein